MFTIPHHSRLPVAPMRAIADGRGHVRRMLGACVFALGLVSCGGGGGGATAVTPINPVTPVAPTPTPVVSGPSWNGFGRDAQHSALGGGVASQPLARLVWRTAVDQAPLYQANGSLLIHYGSPIISAHNTVLVPVKTTTTGGFRIEALAGASGVLAWSAASDYLTPPANWKPSFNPVLTATNRVYMPGAGGKLLYRDDVDAAAGVLQTSVFYGADTYAATKAALDATVFINTPLTADAAGNIYFGFTVTGANPAGLTGGVARLGADGRNSWVSAAAASGNPAMLHTAMNAAPAVSADGKTVYVVVNNDSVNKSRQNGYLLALDSGTLATKASARLTDPNTGALAWINDNSTASPTIGPDGDVYVGVLESNPPAHNFRGWLLHFNPALTQAKSPGAFGWDDTASIVPAAMVPSYTGNSSYLLMTKYNNYAGTGTGDGRNRLAILDPNVTEADPISGLPVMREILSVMGPTSEGDPKFPAAVKEWCINTAAVDPVTRSILVNSEDGYLYRWDLASNQLTEKIQLTSGLGESYTPTALGPDGMVYAINNAVLFAVGR